MLRMLRPVLPPLAARVSSGGQAAKSVCPPPPDEGARPGAAHQRPIAAVTVSVGRPTRLVPHLLQALRPADPQSWSASASRSGQMPPLRSEPKISAPSASAGAWSRTLPVTSGDLPAHSAAEAVLEKKFRQPQLTSSAVPLPLRRPTKTTALSGLQLARPSRKTTVTGVPETGSAEEITASAPSMGGMPSASIAHIAYTRGPAAIATMFGVGIEENG